MPPTEPRSHILAAGTRDPRLRLHRPEPEDGGEEIADPRHYRAVETGLKPARLVIHLRAGLSRSPGYPTLIDVVMDRQFGAAFTLIYSHMMVEVSGRNLAGVAMAIARHRAMTITEYDPQAFDAPAGDAPVIERIEVEVGAAMGEQSDRVATSP